jgi:hypothetical protein
MPSKKQGPELLPSCNKFFAPAPANCMVALSDLVVLIHPQDLFTNAVLDLHLDVWSHARLEGMQALFQTYTNEHSLIYNCWEASSFQTVVSIGCGQHCAGCLRQMCCEYFSNCKVIPINTYRDARESILVDKALKNKINIYHLSLGSNISAFKLVEFLHISEIKIKTASKKHL